MRGLFITRLPGIGDQLLLQSVLRWCQNSAALDYTHSVGVKVKKALVSEERVDQNEDFARITSSLFRYACDNRVAPCISNFPTRSLLPSS